MIDGDGLTYYALARSLVQDHDFDLKNQRQQVPDLHLKINQTTRRIAAHFSFGFGLCYAPFVFVTEKLSGLFPGFAQWSPYHQNKIIPFPHSLAIFTGSLFYGFLTLVLCFQILMRENSQSWRVASFITASVLLGTPLLFYVFTMPSYAHAADAFWTTVAFYLAIGGCSWKLKRMALNNVLLGFVLAISVLLRNNNVVLIPPLVLGAVYRESKQHQRNPLHVLFEIFLGALPFIVLLAQFNLTQYGKMFATGYRVQTEEQFLVEMVFHPDAGLLIWTPITLFGIVGLIAGSIKRRIESIVALASVVLVLLSVQFQPNWWGGCAFGPRFFTHLFVFWAWGLLEWIRLIPKRIAIGVICVCALWTFFLLNLFFVNAPSEDFRMLLRANKCRRSPAVMMQYAVSDYMAAKENGETSNPIHFWFQSLGKGRFPTVQSFLW